MDDSPAMRALELGVQQARYEQEKVLRSVIDSLVLNRHLTNYSVLLEAGLDAVFELAYRCGQAHMAEAIEQELNDTLKGKK